ncbi:MAG: hypothetical protein WC980_07595 [Candidatus Brocadiia bacterium]
MKNVFYGSISWLLLTVIVLVLFITQTRPFHTLLPTEMIIVVEVFQLFFISIILPMFIKPSYEKLLGFYKELFSQVVIMLITFFPLTLMAQYFSLAGAASVIRFYLVILLIGGIAGLCALRNVLRWYYFVWTLIIAAFPMFHYFILEMANKDVRFLLQINPFWLIGRIAEPEIFISNWFLQVLIMVVAFIALNFLRNKKTQV